MPTTAPAHPARLTTSQLAALVALVSALWTVLGCCCCTMDLEEGERDPGLEYEHRPWPEEEARRPQPPAPLTCAANPTPLERPELTWTGSAGALTGKQLTIVAFVEPTGGPGWTPAMRAAAREAVEEAHRFMEAEATRYGATLELDAAYVFEDASFKDWRILTDTPTPGGFDREIKEEVLKRAAGKQRVGAWRDKLKREHGADGVALLIFNAADGRAFAQNEYAPHTDWTVVYNEDGGDVRQMAPVIAHELLHLYGGHDLYAESTAQQALHGLLDRKTSSDVERRWPEAIMLGTRRDAKIQQYISPYTAWLVGWSECTERYFADYRDGQIHPDW